MKKLMLIALINGIFVTPVFADEQLDKAVTPNQAEITTQCDEQASASQLQGEERNAYIEQCKADLLQGIKEKLEGDKE